ncbi:MAG: PIN domain-containing protein [Alphaproteobacteria bacterium]|nr:PIN domain-containing protein [Alphaproteobacteria bacterium]
MRSVLLDTHTWAWALTASTRLSLPSKEAISAAETVYVSPISLFEIGQKVKKGAWPAMEGHLDALSADDQTLSATLSRDVASLAGTLAWTHRDPFDRIIAATAISLGLPLISKDVAFDDLTARNDWPGRLW